MTIRDGKPGEAWVAHSEATGQWALWQILDGDLLTEARELGWTKGVVVACLECGGGLDRPIPWRCDPLYGLAYLTDLVFDPAWRGNEGIRWTLWA